MLLEVKQNPSPDTIIVIASPEGAPPPVPEVVRRQKRISRIAVATRTSASQLVDWDSPSTCTGTVKRRPSISDHRLSSSSMGTSCSSEKSSPETPTSSETPIPIPGTYNKESRLKKPNSLQLKKYNDEEIPAMQRGVLRFAGFSEKKTEPGKTDPGQTQVSNSTISRVNKTKVSPNANSSAGAKPVLDNHKSPEDCDNRLTPSSSSRVLRFHLQGSPNANGTASTPSPIELNGNRSRASRTSSPSAGADSISLSSLLLRELEQVHSAYDIKGAKIYTDWANHYLEKARCKRRIRDLQSDVSDGVLLADVVEAVTGQKVPDVNRKPKTSAQMIENIQRTLGFVEGLGVALEGIGAKDVRDGNLKAILGLFFALSRHKQQQKQLSQRAAERDRLGRLAPAVVATAAPGGPGGVLGGVHVSQPLGIPPPQFHGSQIGLGIPGPQSAHGEDIPRLPSPFNGKHGGTSIPIPATASPARRNPPDKSRHLLPPGSTSQLQLPGSPLKSTSASSSRSTSPSSAPHSFIPTPRSSGNRGSLTEKQINAANRQQLRAPTVGIPSPYNTNGLPQPTSKSSVLDKFRLFNSKDKTDKVKSSSSGTGVSKRTSSSSGFSSARSERSDSSTSLCSDAKPLPSFERKDSSIPTTNNLGSNNSGESSPKSLSHGLRSKLSRGSRDSKQSSPKSSRKDESSKSSAKANKHDRTRNSGIVSGIGGGSVCGVVSALDRDKCQRNGQDDDVRPSRISCLVPPKVLTPSSTPTSRLSAATPDSEKGSSRSSGIAVCVTPERERTPSTRDSGVSDMRSGSNSSASSPPANGPTICNGSLGSLASSSPGSGIPKPTAAVKGTTKSARPESQESVISLKSELQKGEPHIKSAQMFTKDESTVNVNHSANIANIANANNVNVNVSVALVNPLPPKINLNEPPLSKSNSNSNPTENNALLNSNNCTDSNNFIISTENNGLENAIDDEESTMNVKPMQPLLQGYHRQVNASFNGRTLGMPNSVQNGKQQGVFQGNANTKYVSYSNKTDGVKKSNPNVNDCSNMNGFEVAPGYLSDGDVLRRKGTQNSTVDLCDGYMSEGGTAIYTQRPYNQNGLPPQPQYPPHNSGFGQSNQRGKTRNDSHGPPRKLGELSADEGSRAGHLVHGGLGKASPHQTNASASPQQHVGIPTTANASANQNSNPQVVYRVLGSRHVKKLDSGQQTDNSGFRQISNCQWRKYVEGEGAGVPDQLRANNELEGVREREHPRDHSRGGGGGGGAGGGSDSREHREHRQHRDKRVSPVTGGVLSNGFGVGQNGGTRSGHSSAERHRRTAGECKDDYSMRGGEVCNGKAPLVSTGPNSPPPPAPAPSSPPPPSSGSKNKVKGVPPSFGYVKRPTSSGGGAGIKGEGQARTAQVSAVPRTKLKVSGGTQTCTSDYKSYSLTGPTASQLSQSVRDRLMQGTHSLPRNAEYSLSHTGSGSHSGSPSHRPFRPSDGSLSDSNYSDLQNYYANNSPYSSWLRHSSAYTASLPTRSSSAKYEAGMSEADSMESLSSLSTLQQHRASLTHTRLLMHQRDGSAGAGAAGTGANANTGCPSSSPGPGHRLNRSNSIRSTKSEKLYPSMLQRSEETDPYYTIPLSVPPQSHGHGHNVHQHSSQPTSPTSTQLSQGTPPSRCNYPMSSISTSASSHGINRNSMSPYSGKGNSKDDEVHGSSVSLVSTASSLYSTQEEKQAHELRKLRRELGDAHEKVLTLTNQLSTNAHVVSAFEQSLSNMTTRLQHLTSTAEKKDSELLELRQTIELLRKQSVEAGLTSAYIQNMSPNLTRRHTVTDSEAVPISRQLSADSVSSLNSLSSACSHSSSAHPAGGSPTNKKKKGWLRSSFSKAFSRSKKNRNGSVSDVEDTRGVQSDLSAPSSPLLNGIGSPLSSLATQNIKLSQSSSAIYPGNGNSDLSHEGPEVVAELRKQLREKDLVLTDIRLEALSSAHQLESLKDTVMKMRNEMLNLKQDNERLQRIVTSKSLTTSQCSLVMDGFDRRMSLTDTSNSNMDSVEFLNNTTSSSMSVATLAALDPDGKRTLVRVCLGAQGGHDGDLYLEDTPIQICNVAAVSISGKTKWEVLDTLVKRLFKEYLSRVDPTTSLGLGTDSIASYRLGEVLRQKDAPVPELLPCGYLVGDTDSITINLKGAMHNGSLDALAFETLIPKSIAQRFISLLVEHRRIILCGPSGTGKSYLANKLAEFLVLKSGKESTAESIATFNVDHKSSKELRQYLANVAEQCESNAADLPSVIILDNLHHAASLGDVFNGFLNAKYNKCPYIIGTMNQATCSTTNLQLHHNFRWILCANHMEPVKGFLGRFLRRRLLELETVEGTTNTEMGRVLEWIPRVWQHLNKFLETHSSSDVTIGPRLFLSCPTDLSGSQVWFTDLWNYSLVPYLLEAVREGLQLYGRRATWEDPTTFIAQTYPWTEEAVHGGHEALLRLRAEDVGYDIQSTNGSATNLRNINPSHCDTDGDPLLNMLLRLQEAANYSSPHNNGLDSSNEESHASTAHIDQIINSHLESSL